MPVRPLSPEIAKEVSTMLDMGPNRLAKRLKCSAVNASRVQKLMVLIFVSGHKRAQGIPTGDLETRGKALIRAMVKSKQGELSDLLAKLLYDDAARAAFG